MSTVAEVSDATFQAEVLESSLPVLVDFWADGGQTRGQIIGLQSKAEILGEIESVLGVRA